MNASEPVPSPSRLTTLIPGVIYEWTPKGAFLVAPVTELDRAPTSPRPTPPPQGLAAISVQEERREEPISSGGSKDARQSVAPAREAIAVEPGDTGALAAPVPICPPARIEPVWTLAAVRVHGQPAIRVGRRAARLVLASVLLLAALVVPAGGWWLHAKPPALPASPPLENFVAESDPSSELVSPTESQSLIATSLALIAPPADSSTLLELPPEPALVIVPAWTPAENDPPTLADADAEPTVMPEPGLSSVEILRAIRGVGQTRLAALATRLQGIGQTGRDWLDRLPRPALAAGDSSDPAPARVIVHLPTSDSELIIRGEIERGQPDEWYGPRRVIHTPPLLAATDYVIGTLWNDPHGQPTPRLWTLQLKPGRLYEVDLRTSEPTAFELPTATELARP